MSDKKIKIIYLITGLNVGGAEVLLWKFLRRLDLDKYEPIVISFIPIGEIGKNLQKEGFRVESLDTKKVLNEKNKDSKIALVRRALAVFFIEFPRLISIIRKEKPQILHAHLFHANFLGRIAGKICGVPVVISTIHNINFGGRLREMILRYTDWLGTATVAISEKVGSTMLERRVVPEKKLRVIDNGIDLEEFDGVSGGEKNEIRRYLGIEENRFVLVAVGRMAEQKGYPYLLKALEIIKEKGHNPALLLLGEGELMESLKKESESRSLTENVQFLGNKENVRDYLNASDVFVMSSLWEGLPISLLEATACGLPVVATKVGGIPEVVENGQSGFLVESKDPESLAGKILQVMEMSAEERRKMGERGREIVGERFSVEQMTEEYEKLYLELQGNEK